ELACAQLLGGRVEPLFAALHAVGEQLLQELGGAIGAPLLPQVLGPQLRAIAQTNAALPLGIGQVVPGLRQLVVFDLVGVVADGPILRAHTTPLTLGITEGGIVIGVGR